MAQVPPVQTQRILEFIDLVKETVKANTVATSEDAQRNVALALLRNMADANIGLTFPDPVSPVSDEKPPF